MAKPATLEQALAFFDRAEASIPKPPDRPAPGFFTAAELAKEKGVSRSTMKLKLNRLVERGLAEALEGRVKTCKTAYYRILPTK